MSLRKLNPLFVTAALLLAVVSCKDDDETAVLPYLTGLYFDCPSFVSPGQAVTMIPKGVTDTDGEEVGYFWRVTPTMSFNDTTDVFVHWFSDTLKTYTVNCYAYADGYNNDAYSKQVMVVKGGLDQSIKKTGIKSTDSKITVDGTDYYFAKVGDLYWFRNNLAGKESGIPYVNEDITSDIFGRFYNYNQAMSACPQGWRLPTEEDWMSLAAALEAPATKKYSTFEGVTAKLMADASFNETPIVQYWPAVGDVKNTSRLSMLPFGYVNLGNKNDEGKYHEAAFDGIFEYAAFWTADKVDGEEDMAYYRYMVVSQPDMMVGKGSVNSFGAMVRCVRDAN